VKEVTMSELKTIKLDATVDRAVEDVDQVIASGVAVAVSFREVTFVSVAGLEWLEELLLRSQSQGVSVRFVDVPPTIYKVFKVAHIGSLLEACGAVAALGPAC
jgi:anti-anti-sigma regulatory factor